MKIQALSRRIHDILDDIARLNNALYAMDATDIRRFPDNYETISVDAALRGEKVACELRHLVYTTTGVNRDAYLQMAGAEINIRVQEKDGIVELLLPALLPKRMRRLSCEYLTEPIYQALSRYVREHPAPLYRQCAVCFAHVYERSAKYGVRDYDNMEQKQILDVIASFFLTDDGGLYCDAYNTTELGEESRTQIYIMEKKRFPEWLLNRKNEQKGISDF